jgi:hypothetical protein
MEWGCSWYKEVKNTRKILARKPCGKHSLVEERRNNDENFKISLKNILLGFGVPMPMNLP